MTDADWRQQRAILHTLGGPSRAIDVGSVTLVDLATLRASSLPAALLADLESGRVTHPIAATWLDGAPVSFCYAGTMTDATWDVAVDTLEAHRGRGHAMSCVGFMIQHLRQAGRAPIWGAQATNLASLRLAEKLGFVPV